MMQYVCDFEQLNISEDSPEWNLIYGGQFSRAKRIVNVHNVLNWA